MIAGFLISSGIPSMSRLLFALCTSLLSLVALAANPQVELNTNQGKIVLELYADKAPATVANFLQYVRDKHYNGTIFHRVIGNFMIQGGGFDEQMRQKPTRAPIRNEASKQLSNKTYTIAMARTPDPHSATSQFFINVSDNDFLDYRAATQQEYGYCVFGKVIKGQDVVNKIKSVKTGAQAPHNDVPVMPVLIESAVEITAKAGKKK
jgi:cyclophilin family peptidyl-prolyl cis-trans isomerase